jgi:hypothetical protein
MSHIQRDDLDPDGRHYLIQLDGVTHRWPSVTSVLNIIEKAYLRPWAVKMALNRAMYWLEQQLAAGDGQLDAALVKNLLAGSKSEGAQANERILTAAGEFGTVVHECIEEFLETGEPCPVAFVAGQVTARIQDLQAQIEILGVKIDLPDAEAVLAKVQACLTRLYSWWESQDYALVGTELTVYSSTYGYAGTLDCLVWGSCANPAGDPGDRHSRLIMLDWKTSNQYDINYALQCVAYKMAFQEMNGMQIGDIYIVRIGKKDAELEIIHVAESEHAELFQVFLGFLRGFRWKKEYKKVVVRPVTAPSVPVVPVPVVPAPVVTTGSGRKQAAGTPVPGRFPLN